MRGEWSGSDLATKARTRFMAATNGRDGTPLKEDHAQDGGSWKCPCSRKLLS